MRLRIAAVRACKCIDQHTSAGQQASGVKSLERTLSVTRAIPPGVMRVNALVKGDMQCLKHCCAGLPRLRPVRRSGLPV